MMRGLDHRSERNDGILGRDHRSGGRVETVAERQHAQAEAVLGLEDRRAGSIELRARRLGEAEQRSVFGREAQREEAAGVERCARVGRGRVRGRRKRGAVGDVLLDFRAQQRIELAQHDADVPIEHARAQGHDEVERVVARQGQQRGRFGDAGGDQRFVGMRGDGPDDPHFVTGRRRELGAHTLRQRVTADD